MRPVLLLLVAHAACLAPMPPPAEGDAGHDAGADAGAPDAGAPDAGAPDAGVDGGLCPAPAPELQDIVGTPAGPYLVHHPTVSGAPRHTVIFVTGADGSRDIATQFIWPRWLQNGTGVDQMRIVIVYTTDGDIRDETARIAAVAAEVLGCYGGDARHVHLAGTSIGGLTAFATMLESPAPFATLLGAPGAFDVNLTAAQARAALGGKAAFFGVGQLDDEQWRAAAQGTHDYFLRLDAGIASQLHTFPAEGHVLSPAFDETVFFDFWRAH